jgi:hypothetical protein
MTIEPVDVPGARLPIFGAPPKSAGEAEREVQTESTARTAHLLFALNGNTSRMRSPVDFLSRFESMEKP